MSDDVLKNEQGLGYMGEISPVRNPHQDNNYLDMVRKKAETLEITTLDTYTGIDVTAEDLRMSREDFLNVIKGKIVGDLGSGFGGLAMECALNNIPVEIISVNPAIAHPRFRSAQVDFLRLKLRNRYSAEDINKAFAKYESNAYAATSDDLPIESGRLDLIIDDRAITFYSSKIGEQLYRASLLEMLRVLHPGGKIYIADSVHFLDPEVKSFQLQIIEGLGVHFEYFYRQFKDQKTFAVGVILTKP